MDGSRAFRHFEGAWAMFSQEACSKRHKPLTNSLPQTGAEHRKPRKRKNVISRQVGGRVVKWVASAHRLAPRSNSAVARHTAALGGLLGFRRSSPALSIKPDPPTAGTRARPTSG